MAEDVGLSAFGKKFVYPLYKYWKYARGFEPMDNVGENQ